MTTKEQAQEKIRAAADASSNVRDAWEAADDALNRNPGSWVNGCGVLFDHHARRNQLLEAKEQIDRALKELDATQWPTNADYDRAGY